jgi:hypothetical protein
VAHRGREVARGPAMPWATPRLACPLVYAGSCRPEGWSLVHQPGAPLPAGSWHRRVR